MRVLVTGALGMLGTALRERLAVAGVAHIHGVDVTEDDLGHVERVDVTDARSTRELVERVRPDVVYHCAGGVSGTDEDQLTACLVGPTETLLDSVAAVATSTVVVLPGSAAEYGPLAEGHAPFREDDPLSPVSPYGRAKVRQYERAMGFVDRGVDVRVCRIFNLIGPGIHGGFLPGRVALQLRAISRGEAPPLLGLGDLSAVRDYVDLRDACDAMQVVAARGRAGRAYNVCSGRGSIIRDVVRSMIEISGLDVHIEESGVGSSRRGLDASVGSPERIRLECGWRPRLSLEQSIVDTLGLPWSD